MSWQVCDCAAAGRLYGLRLPGVKLAPGQGAAHRQSALRALALYGIDEPPAIRQEAVDEAA